MGSVSLGVGGGRGALGVLFRLTWTGQGPFWGAEQGLQGKGRSVCKGVLHLAKWWGRFRPFLVCCWMSLGLAWLEQVIPWSGSCPHVALMLPTAAAALPSGGAHPDILGGE